MIELEALRSLGPVLADPGEAVREDQKIREYQEKESGHGGSPEDDPSRPDQQQNEPAEVTPAQEHHRKHHRQRSQPGENVRLQTWELEHPDE
jgi:hypothetical protein